MVVSVWLTHCHRLSSYTTSCDCTSWDCAQQSRIGTYLNKPFSSTTHCCYRKHSSHHWCTSFCWSSGGILLNFQSKVLKKFYSSPPSLDKRMKPSRCFTGRFLSWKMILRASQTWKLPISIFVRWKVFRHSMHRFCNGFLQNLKTRTLCWMCTIFIKS
jgi:hypothetical protein